MFLRELSLFDFVNTGMNLRVAHNMANLTFWACYQLKEISAVGIWYRIVAPQTLTVKTFRISPLDSICSTSNCRLKEIHCRKIQYVQRNSKYMCTVIKDKLPARGPPNYVVRAATIKIKKKIVCEPFVSRESSVGMPTSHGLDGPGIEGGWGGRQSKPVYFPRGGVKRPGRGVDHPPPFRV